MPTGVLLRLGSFWRSLPSLARARVPAPPPTTTTTTTDLAGCIIYCAHSVNYLAKLLFWGLDILFHTCTWTLVTLHASMANSSTHSRPIQCGCTFPPSRLTPPGFCSPRRTTVMKGTHNRLDSFLGSIDSVALARTSLSPRRYLSCQHIRRDISWFSQHMQRAPARHAAIWST